MESKEPIQVGIRTTTLKEIEEKDPFQKKLHDSELFEGNRKPLDRFVDVPRFVPFMFGIGGGLHVLYDMDETGQPRWKTIEWNDDTPQGYNTGSIYFEDPSANLYVKVADNPQGGWVWQKLVEEEKLSWKTGKKEWEFKFYFGPENRKAIELNNDLNLQGWSRSSTLDDQEIKVPEGVEYIRLQPSTMHDGTINHFIVYDPERAEVFYAKSRDLDEAKENELESDGWKFVDSNVARAIYVRTKPEFE